jgi:hypothetical protein
MAPGERIERDAVATGDPRHKRLVALLVHRREAVTMKTADCSLRPVD